MSSWRLLIAETQDPQEFKKAIKQKFEPYKYQPKEEKPRENSSTRVRFRLPRKLVTPEDSEEKLPHEDEYVREFIDSEIKKGRIPTYEWIILHTGNDTSNAGSVKIYKDNEIFDEFLGEEQRMGIDAAAYVERYHGVLYDAFPEKIGAELNYYQPEHEISDLDPDNTLADEEPSPPFEFGSDTVWFRVIVEAENIEEMSKSFETYDYSVEEKEPINSNPNRLRFDIQITKDDNTDDSIRDARYNIVEQFDQLGKHEDADLGVVIVGDESNSEAVVRVKDGWHDIIEGEKGYYGADIEKYLEEYYGLEVKATPENPPEIPDDVPIPQEKPKASMSRLEGSNLERKKEALQSIQYLASKGTVFDWELIYKLVDLTDYHDSDVEIYSKAILTQLQDRWDEFEVEKELEDILVEISETSNLEKDDLESRVRLVPWLVKKGNNSILKFEEYFEDLYLHDEPLVRRQFTRALFFTILNTTSHKRTITNRELIEKKDLMNFLLVDDDELVRKYAIILVGYLSDREKYEGISYEFVERLKDPSQDVRLTVLESKLAGMYPPDPGHGINKDLVGIYEEYFDGLIQCLGIENSEIRKHAADYLNINPKYIDNEHRDDYYKNIFSHLKEYLEEGFLKVEHIKLLNKVSEEVPGEIDPYIKELMDSSHPHETRHAAAIIYTKILEIDSESSPTEDILKHEKIEYIQDILIKSVEKGFDEGRALGVLGGLTSTQPDIVDIDKIIEVIIDSIRNRSETEKALDSISIIARNHPQKLLSHLDTLLWIYSDPIHCEEAEKVLTDLANSLGEEATDYLKDLEVAVEEGKITSLNNNQLPALVPEYSDFVGERIRQCLEMIRDELEELTKHTFDHLEWELTKYGFEKIATRDPDAYHKSQDILIRLLESDNSEHRYYGGVVLGEIIGTGAVEIFEDELKRLIAENGPGEVPMEVIKALDEVVDKDENLDDSILVNVSKWLEWNEGRSSAASLLKKSYNGEAEISRSGKKLLEKGKDEFGSEYTKSPLPALISIDRDLGREVLFDIIDRLCNKETNDFSSVLDTINEVEKHYEELGDEALSYLEENLDYSKGKLYDVLNSDSYDAKQPY